MRRLWPQTLTAQLVGLLLLALVVAQLATFAILRDERRGVVEALAREQVLERTATLVRLIETTPGTAERRRALGAFSTRQLRFWVAAEPVVDTAEAAAAGPLTRQLARLLEDGRGLEVRVAPGDIQRQSGGRPHWHGQWRRAMADRHAPMGDQRALDAPPPRLPASGLLLAIRLDDSAWLNAAMVLPPERPGFGPAPMAALLAAAVAISLVAALSLRRLTRPLAALAAAADAVGRGEPSAVAADRGPVEVRRTAQAFNLMQTRINRAMTDRTQLLAAISHDLRTPITTLRLRAEMVDDTELRERMLVTLDEMQALTEAGLLLARGTASEEPTRPVDLVALIQSIADDFADQGREVCIAPAPPLVQRCRKGAMTRALRNLVENALRYGEEAEIAIAASPETVTITIDDHGPGLPAAMLERVFEPFFRLDASRSPETGGSGLGLAIARAIIRGHGGDIVLANRPTEGGTMAGLRATVQLPTDRGSAI